MDYLELLKNAFLDELEKIGSDLTASAREHIAKKNFALTPKQSDTGKPAYPIEDKAHAANALARVKQHGTPEQRSEVYKDVAKKYPELAARSDVSALRERVKKATIENTIGGFLGAQHAAGESRGLGSGLSGVAGGELIGAATKALANKYPGAASAIETGSLPASYLAGILAGKGYVKAKGAIQGKKKESFDKREALKAALEEAGPAVGATLGAGLSAGMGKGPLSGAALGYGVGSLPGLLHGKHKG